MANTNVDQITTDTSGLSLDGSATTDALTRFYFRIHNSMSDTFRRMPAGARQEVGARDRRGIIQFNVNEHVAI